MNGAELKIRQFADDTQLLAADYNSLARSLDWVERMIRSGLMLRCFTRKGFSPNVASRRGCAGVRRVGACTGGRTNIEGRGQCPPPGTTRTPGSPGMAGVRG